jgi:dienelactone hydrolase
MPRRLLIIGALLALGGCQEERPVTTAPPDPFTQQVAFSPVMPTTQISAPGVPPASPAPPPSIPATLRLPPGEGRVPAVVIVHGSGGVDGRGALYAEALRRAGIATIEPDLWAPRGIDRRRGVQQRPPSTLHTIPDTYGALRFLAQHPRIDPDRIGVMGMSWGGVTSLRTARADVQQAYAGQGPRFRAFAPLYPGCSYWADGGVSAGEFDQNWPDGPLLLLVPEQEDYNTSWGREPCDSMLARVPEPARRNVTLHMYPGVTHGWDRQEMPASITFFDPGAAGRRGGTVRMRADGPTTADGAQRIVEFFTRSLATR